MIVRSSTQKPSVRESFEPDFASDLNSVELHADGDFTINGHRRRQADADLHAAIAPPWVCSKVAGEGQDLLLTNMHSGDKRTYRYVDGGWRRRFLWKPVTSTQPFGLIGLFPDRIHCNPTLEQFFRGEEFRRQILLGDGAYVIECGPWREWLLSVTLPDEQVHYFSLSHGKWYELFPTQRDSQPSPWHPPPVPPALRVSFRRDMAWVDVLDSRAVERFHAADPDKIAWERFSSVQLFTDGALAVARSRFSRDDALDLDFLTVRLRRTGDLLQVDELVLDVPSPDAESTNPPESGKSPKRAAWKSHVLRHHDGRWQIHLPDASPDRFAEFWAEHGYWLSYVIVLGLLALAAGTLMRLLFDVFPWLERILNYVIP